MIFAAPPFAADGAPPPQACVTHLDCVGASATDDTGCCSTGRFLPLAAGYVDWIRAWQAQSCAAVLCPPPGPPVVTPACHTEAWCAEGTCRDTCGSATEAARFFFRAEMSRREPHPDAPTSIRRITVVDRVMFLEQGSTGPRQPPTERLTVTLLAADEALLLSTLRAQGLLAPKSGPPPATAKPGGVQALWRASFTGRAGGDEGRFTLVDVPETAERPKALRALELLWGRALVIARRPR